VIVRMRDADGEYIGDPAMSDKGKGSGSRPRRSWQGRPRSCPGWWGISPVALPPARATRSSPLRPPTASVDVDFPSGGGLW